MIKPLAIGFIKIGLVLGIALSRPLFQESPWPCALCTKEISSSSLQFVVVETLLFIRPFRLPRLNRHPFTLHTPVFIVVKPCQVTHFTHVCRPFFPLISPPPCLSAHKTTSPITFLSHFHTLINCLSPNMAKVSFKTNNCLDGLILKCETKPRWGVLIKL
jgi:hypothetical protein